MGIKIIATASKMPARTVTNCELTEFLDTSDEWITSMTGIKARGVCGSPDELTQLAAEAAKIALDRADMSLSEIDTIICATMSGDYLMPSMACCVLEQLNTLYENKRDCPAYDINAACSGFVYALDLADSVIAAGKAKNILLVSAEMMSRALNWQDRTTCILFGDGAAATILTAGDNLKYIRITAEAQIKPLFTKANTNTPFAASEPAFLEMQGQNVYRFAVKTIEREINLALTTLNLQPDEIDFFLLHQANTRIIEGAQTRLKLPKHKFPTNIQNHGNMSAASIPVLLDELITSKTIQPGNRLILLGFGAGMTCGTAVLDY
ncbi:MAG: beta-ketoacyl-ACP synthase 3 [Turicibacter sp.]|nr:beta-ketoacyl-ACP synthase 3 [Turicibacter sp.]